MPKETVERTETEVIEKTHEESIIICDNCGMGESDRNISKFTSTDYENGLYFCNECLSENNTSPITEHVAPADRTRKLTRSETRQLIAIIIYASTLPMVVGGVLSGVNGLFIGLVLTLTLIVVLALMEEQPFSG